MYPQKGLPKSVVRVRIDDPMLLKLVQMFKDPACEDGMYLVIRHKKSVVKVIRLIEDVLFQK